ncbi:MAG TPA: hypothetical protein PKA63_07850 [Oligoflexia bacterium]|nr:hypothetical protein [Oligoflexia bacterium]HMP48563.1 hypothetical protein [Oligoflexia bacterium]
MYSFDVDVLILPCILIFLATFGVTLYATKSAAFSILASIVKAGFFLIYFGYFFDGKYTFSDDITYLHSGIILLKNRINIFNIIEEWRYIRSVVGGTHVGYNLINAFAVFIFGEYYFAPVVFNTLLILPIAFFGSKLASLEFGFDSKYKKIFYAFLLFHPDIFTWSSMLNLKDTIVLLLHITMLYAGSLYFRGHIKLSMIIGTISFFLLSILRFYVPLLIVLALFISIFFTAKIRSRFFYLVLGGGLLAMVILGLGTGQIQYSIDQMKSSMTNPVTGFIRATLTPIPFHTDESYDFLNLPALFHWIMIPVVLLGVNQIRKIKTPFTMFFLIYLYVFLALYGVYSELQGPRHRVQLDFALAVLQFVGFLNLLRAYRVIDRKKSTFSR